MSAININKNNFQNEIMDSEKTVLLDFWAPWCAPCRMVVPIVEEIASEAVQPEELQLQQEYEDWMNMQKLLCLKDLDTYPMRIVGFHIILET